MQVKEIANTETVCGTQLANNFMNRDGKKAQARRVYPKPEIYGPGIPEARRVRAGYGLKNIKNRVRVRVWDLVIPTRYPARLPELYP